MATKKRASSRRPPRVSYESFFAHDDLIAVVFGIFSVSSNSLRTGILSPPSPFRIAVSQLKRTAFARLLHAAGQENSPEAFKGILQVLILFLGVETPVGVFTPMRKPGKPGRPISSEGEQIHSRWVEMGMPSPSKNALAQAFYGALFTKASGSDRRKLRDKCRQAVDRCLERWIADQQRELAKVSKETAQLREQIVQYERELAERKAAGP
jgi:hypothetical protein